MLVERLFFVSSDPAWLHHLVAAALAAGVHLVAAADGLDMADPRVRSMAAAGLPQLLAEVLARHCVGASPEGILEDIARGTDRPRRSRRGPGGRCGA